MLLWYIWIWAFLQVYWISLRYEFLCKCQSAVIGIIWWENYIINTLCWCHYYVITSLSNCFRDALWMHRNIIWWHQGKLGDFWLWIGIGFVYFEGIWRLQPASTLWCTLGNLVKWLYHALCIRFLLFSWFLSWIWWLLYLFSITEII